MWRDAMESYRSSVGVAEQQWGPTHPKTLAIKHSWNHAKKKAATAMKNGGGDRGKVGKREGEGGGVSLPALGKGGSTMPVRLGGERVRGGGGGDMGGGQQQQHWGHKTVASTVARVREHVGRVEPDWSARPQNMSHQMTQQHQQSGSRQGVKLPAVSHTPVETSLGSRV